MDGSLSERKSSSHHGFELPLSMKRADEGVDGRLNEDNIADVFSQPRSDRHRKHSDVGVTNCELQ
jgi:hypothetical protein